MSFFGLFGNDLAIDLGTSNVRVYVRDKGVVLREPCVVAVHSELRRQVLAVGEEAKSMMGRTPGGISAIRPLKDGVIADFDVTEVMLRYLIKKAGKHFFSLGRPSVVITVPCGVTPVERRAVDEAARNAGARSVYIVEGPMAAAIGAGLPIASPTGSMIVNIGGGTCEVAVMSLGGIVSARSIRMGGDKFDEAIIEYIKREHNLLIGERTAEEVKLSIGAAMLGEVPMTATVRGRDLISGFPQTLQVDSDEIRQAMHEPLSAVLGAIKSTLESTPPELSADIMQRGIVLCGGGCLLGGLDALISMETGIPVFLADDPTDCAIFGAGKLTEDADLKHLTARNSREE